MSIHRCQEPINYTGGVDDGEGGGYVEEKKLCPLCQQNEATIVIVAKAQEGDGKPNELPIGERICTKCFFKNL